MENNEVMNNEEIEVTETNTEALEPMEEVPEYLFPADDDSSCECEDEDEGMSTTTKVALGAGAALTVGAIVGGILLKRKKDKQADEADPEAATRGPKPISDKKAKVKAIRGRKLTLREKLSGRIYLDPAEVELFQQLQEMQKTETDEESTEA